METETFKSPAFIGGVPNNKDFAPSIIMVIAFSLLIVPAYAYRQMHSYSRSYTTIINVLISNVDRVVTFGLRAAVCRGFTFEGRGKGVLVYMQISFMMNWFGMLSDSNNYFRVLLVNSTLPDLNNGVDLPRRRFWFRRFCDIWGLIYLAASVPGIIAGTRTGKSTYQSAEAHKVYRLRIVSSAVILFLQICWVCILLAARIKIKNIKREGINRLLHIALILLIIPIYRLGVLHKTVTVTVPPNPGADAFVGQLTGAGDKALFYIFHIVPEWFASALFLTDNLRKTYNAGPFGDWRGTDKKGLPRPRRDGVLIKDLESKQEEGSALTVVANGGEPRPDNKDKPAL